MNLKCLPEILCGLHIIALVKGKFAHPGESKSTLNGITTDNGLLDGEGFLQVGCTLFPFLLAAEKLAHISKKTSITGIFLSHVAFPQ